MIGATYGVAKSVNLIGVKVLRDDGKGTVNTAINGISWALQRISATGRPGVLSMSLGTIGISRSMNDAIKGATDAGVFFSAASGNRNTNACNSSPGSSNAMVVGATDVNDRRAGYSNLGGCLDIFAPGSGIWSACKW